MYSTRPIHWNIKSAPASPGRSRVGPALYVFSLLGLNKSAELGTISKSIRDAVDAALTDERDSLT
jgi:hypothetical protein